MPTRRVAAVALLAMPLCARAQTPPAEPRFTGPEESFEVASVKPNQSDARPEFDNPPGRVVGTNVVLRDLIRYAYFIYGGDWDIRIAAPEWTKNERFDIDAKTPGTVDVQRAMSMLRQLLAVRFGLNVHYEIRQRPIYALTLARSDRRLGPQLKPSTTDCASFGAAMQAARQGRGTPPPLDPAHPTCGSTGEPGHSLANALTMQQLALRLAKDVGRPVTDDTGLGPQGYDWDLRWTPITTSPDGQPVSNGPSIFTALEEQLGLKLVAKDGPVQVLVIDEIHRPDAN